MPAIEPDLTTLYRCVAALILLPAYLVLTAPRNRRGKGRR